MQFFNQETNVYFPLKSYFTITCTSVSALLYQCRSYMYVFNIHESHICLQYKKKFTYDLYVYFVLLFCYYTAYSNFTSVIFTYNDKIYLDAKKKPNFCSKYIFVHLLHLCQFYHNMKRYSFRFISSKFIIDRLQY